MFSKMNRNMLRLISKPPKLAYKLGLGSILGGKVLLITTIGRKTGKDRVTPLQYEIINGVIQAASATGTKADWYRNIEADPHIRVRMGKKEFEAIAEATTDADDCIDYLLFKLKNHPVMTRAIFLLDGIPMNPDREFLQNYAQGKALVKIHPAH